MSEKKEAKKNEKSKKPSKLDKKLNELEQQVEELTNDLKRAHADFVNYRRRADEERVESVAYGQRKAVLALLPTIDNIQRAVNYIPPELQENEWAKGIQKVAGNLFKDLEKIGVSTIGEPGEPFDPELHEAVAAEGEGENEIVSEVLQSGFSFNGSVIRHAMVKVKNQ